MRPVRGGSPRPVYINMQHPNQTIELADGCTRCATHSPHFQNAEFLRKNGLRCTLHCEIDASSITIGANLECCLVYSYSVISSIFSICPTAAFRSYWHFEIRMSRVGARTQPIVGISIVCGLDLQSANIVRVNYNGSHTTKDVRLLSSSAYMRRVHSTLLAGAFYDFLCLSTY